MRSAGGWAAEPACWDLLAFQRLIDQSFDFHGDVHLKRLIRDAGLIGHALQLDEQFANRGVLFHDDQSSAVQCVVNRYGPSDFTKSYGKSVDAAEVLPLFLGGDLATARPQHIRASPLNWATPNAAPTLLLHGTEDKYVAYEQAVWMRDRLQACGVETQLVTFEGAGHGFKGDDAARAEQALIAFFEKQLK